MEAGDVLEIMCFGRRIAMTLVVGVDAARFEGSIYRLEVAFCPSELGGTLLDGVVVTMRLSSMDRLNPNPQLHSVSLGSKVEDVDDILMMFLFPPMSSFLYTHFEAIAIIIILEISLQCLKPYQFSSSVSKFVLFSNNCIIFQSLCPYTNTHTQVGITISP